MVSGAQSGALSQADGRYVVPGLRAGGPYRIEARMIGFGLQVVEDVTLSAGQARTIDFVLSLEAIALDALEVFASTAQEKVTPVAYSEVTKVELQNQLGSRDLPLILNTSPSVYSTVQGGGAGDARINVRGFSQRNTAVMINGVPVNDMENGWVYWSNWSGIGDATRSVQLQRGLSAVNLATPSIGGTLNIITDPSKMDAGFSWKQEFGNGGFLKETLVASTGNIGRFSAMASVVRKTADGLIGGGAVESDGLADGINSTWTDEWGYYFASAFQINPNNRLELYAVGAPQRHGQNLYKLNIGTISQEFAEGLDDYDSAALSDFPQADRKWGPNVNSVSSSYTGKQYTSSGPGNGTFDRYDEDFLNERENYFHKPQVNLNWYSSFGNGLSLSTVGYYSGGRGGGTGTYGSLVWDYQYTQRFADWDGTIQRNIDNGAGGSRGILRNSVNNQDTWGVISKLTKEYDNGWTASFGADWRTATIEHYREVRDLLGGSFYNDCFRGCSSDFWSAAEEDRGLGDKINYFNENTVDWLGGYVQANRETADGAFWAMAGLSQISYSFVDFFRDRDDDGNPDELDSGNISGYQLKGGITRNVTDEFTLFGNVGYVSKVPIFDGVIDDNDGVKNPDPKNEKFTSFELGLRYRGIGNGVSADLNLYNTTWRDRTFNYFVRNLNPTSEEPDGLVNLLGVDARHMGIEGSLAYAPNDLVRFDVAASVGNWKYLEDVSGTYKPDDQSSETETLDFYIKDLKVADAPQTQIAYAVSLFPAPGLYLRAQGKTFARHWAAFEPFSRQDDPGDERIQSWQAPGYTVFDLHAAYSLGEILPSAGDLRLFVNVYNLFDELYIQDATDNSRFNGFDGDHDADDAEVFFGFPRTVNLGFQVSW
jgi:outer membrane receptor protein involved in Fe transport